MLEHLKFYLKNTILKYVPYFKDILLDKFYEWLPGETNELNLWTRDFKP